ncbi:glutathione S-transferase family protein [Novosphingobium sp. JCM 18896]|uniref:glutathione S-transferase family protein n=1 Tax=Novosphingobium sp. JCM 18896 TaxID=2989731 RepID=UPI0022231E4F|nr:glutathione S-transferase family protein [Novosphingobium sp. JCM 18896]MCW1427878.1 glutathione S-transferase family protein [Novosphingobium sp. JCM 18896]
MQVFGGLPSPYVRKVALVLEEKGLPWNLKLLSPGSEDAEFRLASPFGKIPAFIDDDYRLADSTAIVTYIEAQYPEKPMLPADPRMRGRAMWFDEFTDTIFCASGLKIMFNRVVAPKFLKIPGNEDIALEGERELPRSLDYVESVVPESGWLLGEDFTLADISVASMFRTLAYVGITPSQPKTVAWYARVCERPAWQVVAEMEAYRPAKAG